MDLKQGMETLRVNKTFRGILSTLLSIGIFLNGNEVGIECQPNDIRLIRLFRGPTRFAAVRGDIDNFVLTAGRAGYFSCHLADCPHFFQKKQNLSPRSPVLFVLDLEMCV